MFFQTMTDNSRKNPTPPFGSRRPARQQSQDDRDVEGFAALKERQATPPDFTVEEVTGKYEGEELAEYRERRPTPDRLKRLEKKHDELKGDVEKKHAELKGDVNDVRKDVKELSGHVGDLREDVAGAVGKLDGQQGVLKEMLSIVKKSAEFAVERDHIKVTTTLDVDKAQELAKVEVDKEAALAQVGVTKAEQLDVVEARKVKRKAIAKLVGGLFVGMYALYEFMHRLGVL